MERRKLFCDGHVNISKSEHVLKAIFTPAFIAAGSPKDFRIFECTEENVPKRNIGKVISVVMELMMDSMRLRALENEPKPRRRSNIPVIEKFTDRDEDGVVTRR